MPHGNSRTRIQKYKKRRQNTVIIPWLLIICSSLMVIFFIRKSFSEIDDPNYRNEEKYVEQSQLTEDKKDENNNDYGTIEDKEYDQVNDQDHQEYENVDNEFIEDENVISSFTKDWEPIGTEQTEPHVIQYDEGTQDRKEMEEAVKLATGLDDMIVWWLGREGEQEVVATVTPRDQSETFRTYLSWIEEEGWQPIKVENLQENPYAKE